MTNGSITRLATRALTAIALGLIACAGQAQFSKGDFRMGLGGSWKAKHYRVKETLEEELNVHVGYYFADRISAGVLAQWGLDRFSYSETKGDPAITYTNYKEGRWGGLGPYVRANLGVPRFSFFGQLGATFGSLEQDSENNLTAGNELYYHQEGTYQQYSFSIGLWWFFIQRLGAEVSVTSDFTNARIRSGNVMEDGEIEHADWKRISDNGGGWCLRLIYHFRLDKGSEHRNDHVE